MAEFLCCLPTFAARRRDLTYENVFRITIVQFLDRFNFCVGNVKRSCIHFVTPAGQIIPFDTYNLFYRNGRIDEIRAKLTRRGAAMTDPGGWSSPPPPPPPGVTPPASGAAGCLTAFMIVAGIILLLPGVCAGVFAYMSITSSRLDDTVFQLMMIGFLVALGGSRYRRRRCREATP